MPITTTMVDKRFGLDYRRGKSETTGGVKCATVDDDVSNKKKSNCLRRVL
jgi:hypothetical protein